MKEQRRSLVRSTTKENARIHRCLPSADSFMKVSMYGCVCVRFRMRVKLCVFGHFQFSLALPHATLPMPSSPQTPSLFCLPRKNKESAQGKMTSIHNVFFFPNARALSSSHYINHTVSVIIYLPLVTSKI